MLQLIKQNVLTLYMNGLLERVEGDWSLKGGAGKRQPDNREEEITGKNDEACLAVLK